MRLSEFTRGCPQLRGLEPINDSCRVVVLRGRCDDCEDICFHLPAEAVGAAGFVDGALVRLSLVRPEISLRVNGGVSSVTGDLLTLRRHDLEPKFKKPYAD